MNFAVDLDGTLCEEQEDWSAYNIAKPIPENIAKINNLFHTGHNIIIYTSRHPSDEEVTLKWLKDNGVKFHKVVFGKMRADYYIDERSGKVGDIYDSVILGRIR